MLLEILMVLKPDLWVELGFPEYVNGIDHKCYFPQLTHERNG